MANHNAYEALKARQEEEFNRLPIKYAFDDEQIAQIVREFGVSSKDELTSIFGAGDIICRKDLSYVKSVIRRHDDELHAAIVEDKTGEGFIYDMFESELSNHEFKVTLDVRETLWACGLTYEEVRDNDTLRHGFCLAIEKVLDD